MLKNGYRDRQVAKCNDSDDEDVFDSDTLTVVDTNQEAEEHGEQCNQKKGNRCQTNSKQKSRVQETLTIYELYLLLIASADHWAVLDERRSC